MPSLSFSQTSWSIYSLSNSIHPKLYRGLGFHKFHINKSHDHEIMLQILIFIDFIKVGTILCLILYNPKSYET